MKLYFYVVRQGDVHPQDGGRDQGPGHLEGGNTADLVPVHQDRHDTQWDEIKLWCIPWTLTNDVLFSW